eukprot:151005-Amphidinium_carterae.1
MPPFAFWPYSVGWEGHVVVYYSMSPQHDGCLRSSPYLAPVNSEKEDAASQAPGVLFRDLVRYFIANEPTLGMDESLRDMMTACREILLSGIAHQEFLLVSQQQAPCYQSRFYVSWLSMEAYVKDYMMLMFVVGGSIWDPSLGMLT